MPVFSATRPSVTELQLLLTVIGKRLEAAHLRLGYSREGVALLLSLPLQRLHLIEQGLAPQFNLGEFCPLCPLYGADTHELVPPFHPEAMAAYAQEVANLKGRVE